jgi:hypothetical protein
MTSIEWLVKELKLEGYDHTIQQAKEMHRFEIEEAFKHGRLPVLFGELTAEQYYQETFVSKGSGMSEKPNNHIDAQFPQQEISDEEIEKAARDYDNAVIYGPPLLHFEQGAFWYREQLKQKQ